MPITETHANRLLGDNGIIHWRVIGISYSHGTSRVVVDAGCAAFPVQDVVYENEKEFADFCADFQNWSNFHEGVTRLPAPLHTQAPITPPCGLHTQKIQDMVMWQDKWLVIMSRQALVRIEDLYIHKDLEGLKMAFDAFMKRNAPVFSWR